MPKRLTYQEVKSFIEGEEGNGCKLISTEYINSHSKLKIKCSCGNMFEVRFCDFKNKNQRQCLKCGNELKGENLTYQEVKSFIEGEEGNGCKLISDNYKNNKTKLKIKCSCGNIFETRFTDFKNNNQRQCLECGLENTKIGYQEVKDFIENNGCELISTKYINCYTKLKIKCPCGEIFEARFRDFKRSQFRCSKCGHKMASKKMRGENNPNYNPNLTDEDREERRKLLKNKEWRNKVFERDNYICKCCGKKGGSLNAHHLNGYHWDKEHRFDVSNGVTLCDKCHKNFHDIYGRKNNTLEQFEEYLYNKN